MCPPTERPLPPHRTYAFEQRPASPPGKPVRQPVSKDPAPGAGRSLPERLLRILPVSIPLLLLLVTGLRGIDFGRHWDEGRAYLQPLEASIERGVPLPSRYNYPSVGYALTVVGLAPEAFEAYFGGGDVGMRKALLETVRSPEFHLRLRKLFLFVSAAGVLWLYLLLLWWRDSVAQALLGATLLASSWEVAYHIRWIAPDGLLMQFGALTLLCAVQAARAGPRARRWLYLAAIAAGLATGTKYPGGLLMVPVGIAALYLTWQEVGWRPWWQRAAFAVTQIAVIAGVVYLLTTPGTLLESSLFREHLNFEYKHYREDGHGVYSVPAGAEHARRMLTYLSSQVLSPYSSLSFVLFLLIPLGAYAMLRERWQLGLLVISFPLLYIAYMSTMKAMIVRNLLVLAPFLALLATRGATYLWRILPSPELRGALATVALALAAINGRHLVQAADSIATRDPARDLDQLVERVLDDPDREYLLSPAIWGRLLERNPPPELPNALDRGAPGNPPDFVALFHHECQGSQDSWKIEPADVIWFGPRDVNFHYYPTWIASERILLMSLETAQDRGIPLVEQLMGRRQNR